MKLLDLTLPTPAENLACDEALLDWREEEGGAEILRFWEPREHFVVVGYANKVSTEASIPACAAAGIPILRRCSGGGTVLQGPGCLNYSLILKITEEGPLAAINSTNRFIMERNRAALEKLFLDTERERRQLTSSSNPLTPALAPFGRGKGVEPVSATPSSPARSQLSTLNSQLRVQGHTDLTLLTHHASRITPQKFSGNAQRRKRRFLLFHGTFLLRFNISLVENFLQMPAKQPDYRQNRAHSDFLTNLDVLADPVKHALREAWQADAPLETRPRERIDLLSHDKYATKEWTFKF